MKLAYSYVRFSSDRQKHGQSLSRQTKLSADWCAANGAVLDTELNLHDLGVSAFRGKNLNEGALGAFVKAVDEGRVPKGSYLLIESFDRLSRQEVDVAYQTFRELLKRDINIVTLQDQHVFTKDSLNNFSEIIISIVTMQRAHEESVRKSFLQEAAWKRRRANIKTTKIATRYPSWLTLEKPYSQFGQKKEAVKAIQRIFKEYASGKGVVSIARDLNSDNVPCISGRSKIWKTHYIQQLLRSRSLLGEYTPRKRSADGKKRLDASPTISDYFPRVIDDALFNRVQRLLGKVPRDTSAKNDYGLNIFSKKLFCPYCGERIFVAYNQVGKVLSDGTRKHYTKTRSLCCLSSKNGRCLNVGWPMKDFEKAFLAASTELHAHFSPNNKTATKLREAVAVLKTTIASKERQLARLKALVTDDEAELPEGLVASWREIESDLKRCQKELTEQENALNIAVNRNPYENLRKITSLSPSDRVQAYEAIQSTVSRIYLFFAGTRFQFAKAKALTLKLRAQKVNPSAVAHIVRKEYKIPETRFFVVHLLSPGENKRLVYPKQAAADMADVQDLPDDAELAVK